MGGILTYLVTATVLYMLVLRSAERFSCRFDVALRLFVVSEH